MRDYRSITLKTPKKGIPSYQNEHETFHLIKGSDTHYISSYGRIAEKKENGFVRVQPMLKIRLMVNVIIDGCEIAKRVDELVAEEFLIPIPGKNEIVHKDGRFDNCRYDNLVYVDKDEQIFILQSKLARRPKHYIRAIFERQQYSQFARFNYAEIRRDLYNMKHRCYNKKYSNHKYYKNVDVCDQWLDKENGLSTFTDWAWKNVYEFPEVLQIDKDILSFGKSNMYGPETTCYIPRRINELIKDFGEKQGVSETRKNGTIKYCVSKRGKYKSKQFANYDDAKNYFYEVKAKILDDIIDEELQRGYIPIKIIEVLQQWAEGWRNGLYRSGDDAVDEAV